MNTEKSAGAVIYRMTDDRNVLFLLLQAAPGKPWGFAKGKMDEGETEEMAARREIAEEADLPQVAFDPDFRHVVRYLYRRGRAMISKEVVYFLARTETEEVNISWEHVAYRWVTLAEGLTLIYYENARNTLLDAYKHLKKSEE